MSASISELLARLEAPGTFATRSSAPAEALELEVKGVGRLRFPITPRVARKLRSVASPSPFGLRDQTLHDPSVRDTWEIPASQVTFAGKRWEPELARHLRTLQTKLGLPGEYELEAVPDKLLLYEEGQFFKSHQDSEKRDDMVATLVVVLPSQYSGGALTVEHRGEKKTFRRLESQATELSLLAFYADCHHAVAPIQSGARVALTYQLMLSGRTRAAPPPAKAALVDRLAERIRQHFSTPAPKRFEQSEPAPPQRLVYLLDHEYTQRSLSWTRLKNGDRVRAGALQAAAERLGCECFLALAEVHETWACEDDYYNGRYERRGWRAWQEADADDEASYELVELQESEIELHHWIDAEGRQIEGLPGWVHDAELQLTKPSSELEPFKSEYEGYQGNYGNSLDRWYHRAALVMWPRENTFALRAQVSPQWAVEQLLALPREDTAGLEARVRMLLPAWTSTAGRVEDSRFFAKLLGLSKRLEEPALVHEWLAPLGVHRLRTRAVRRDLVTLVDKHGLSWAQGLFAEWTKHARWGTPAWAPLLAVLCEDLKASQSAPCAALASWLLAQEAKAALERCRAALRVRQPWLGLGAFAEEATHLAHVLAAAAAVSEPRVLEDTTLLLLGDERHSPTSFLVELLQRGVARSPALREQLTGSALHRACVERLEAILQAPPRAHDDWSIVHPLGCGCADCKELSAFLLSARTELDWPLRQDRRQHLEGMIAIAKLPVRHRTLARGSPHVLQLRKDPSLFSREAAYRARVKELLESLPTVPR